MARKAEIKVYLPDKLVGELEERRKAGVRSRFIEKAIRKALRGQNDIDLWDIELHELIKIVRARCFEDTVINAVLTRKLEELQ